MRAPYGLNIIDNCVTCPIRGQHLFCNLSLQSAQRLNEIKSTGLYPKGALLFIEGQQPRGVFICVREESSSRPHHAKAGRSLPKFLNRGT